MADELETTTDVVNAEAKVEMAVADAELTDEVLAEATADEVDVAEAEASEEPTIDQSKSLPDFRSGDTLRLGLRIQEGDKTRTQYFEGIVLARKGAGVNQTFTIRKIGAGGIAVERIFPVFSPTIVSMEVRRRGIVRRAKIYFLRDVVGSTANVIKERKVAKSQQDQQARAAKKAAKAEKKAAKPVVKKVAKKSTTRSASRSSRKGS
jgi:large subunit ribosomal protein L19